MQHLLDKPSSRNREVWYLYYWQRFVLRYLSIWGPCLLIGGVALGFDLYHVGAPSLWFDEVLSVVRAQQPMSVLGRIVLTTQPNMALYYVILHYWLRVTQLVGLNPTETVVRLPSTLFAAASSIAVYLLGKRFVGVRAGLVAAGLYVVNALQLTYAQETRSYSLQLLLLCIVWYAFLSALTMRRRVHLWWICYSVAATLAIYTHLVSLLVLFALACTYACLLVIPTVWRNAARRQVRAFLLSTLAIGIASAPMLYAARNGGKTGWLASPNLHAIRAVFIAFAGNNRAFLLFCALVCLIGVCSGTYMLIRCRTAAVGTPMSDTSPLLKSKIAAVVQFGKKSAPLGFSEVKEQYEIIPFMLCLLCWCIIPFVISFIVSQGPTRLFSSRYLVVMVPPLLLFTCASLEWLTWPRIRSIVSVLLLICAACSVPYYYRSAQVEDWNTTTAWLQQRYQPHDGMVCYDNGQGCQICVEYYLEAYPQGITFPADSPGAFSWPQYDLTNQLGDPGQAVNPMALAAYAAHHTRIFFIAGRVSNAASEQRAEHWLDTHYHLVDQIVTATVTIHLYQVPKNA